MYKLFAISVLMMGAIFSDCIAQSQMAPDYQQLIDEYRSLIKDEMNKNNVAGLSIALVGKDGIIWSEGFGYENLEDSIPATGNTVYGIGSVTKIFTATAIMQLAEKNKIDIDKPVTDYVPELKMKSIPEYSGAITTRMLLTHYSGFPSDLFGSDVKNETYKDVVTNLNSNYTAFKPNYISCYSNIGYGFLGYTIDKLSKQDYAEYITQNIFNPLGMKNSVVFSNPDRLITSCKAYNQDKAPVKEMYSSNLSAGGIYSSVNDMSLFIRAWLSGSGKLLNNSSIQQMFTPQNDDNQFVLNHHCGLCWNLKPTDYDYRAEHGGALYYYRAHIEINRYAGLGVIMLSNSSNAGAITWRTSEIIDKACKIKGVEEKKIDAFDAATIVKKNINLNDYAGNYGQNLSWYPFFVRDSSLVGKPGNDSLAFKLKNDGYFGLLVKQREQWVAIPDQQFIFTELNGEKVFLAQQWGNWNIAAEMYPDQDINEVWTKRLGKYKVLNRDSNSMILDAELAIAENTLYLSAMTPMSDQPMGMPFEIKNDKLAFVLGTSTYSGSALQVINENGTETLYFMGLRLEKIM